jgi:tetratricopeptide (TPR) repeat protein
MSKNKLRSLLLGFLFLLAAISVSAQDTSATSEADALFTAKKWSEAAPAYEALTKTNPNDGRIWYRLGYSFHLMGKYGESARAFQRSVEIGNNPLVMYNLACAYSRLGEKDKAFEWLNKSLTLGFVAPQLTSDPDLVGLHSDARFKEVTTVAARLAQPCKFRAEHKQFDFWVGDWDVKTPQGQLAGTNTIQRLEDGCLILENWTGSQGGTGKSMNFYNAATDKWRQTWVSSAGGVTEYEGSYRDGAMRYEGESMRNGTKLMLRLTFFDLGPDRVRQFAEQSADAGKNWTVTYDFTYIRKKS